MDRRLKIAIVVSHPIQHFCPQYASFTENEDIELKVFFGSALGFKKYTDINFKKEIAWSNLYLEKFEHVFLNGEEVVQPDKDLDAPSLYNELDQFRPSIIITYGYFQKLQRRTKKWANERNIPLAYISDAENRKPGNFVKHLLKLFFLKRYFTSFKYFLTVGDANEAYYKKYGVPSSKMIRMHFPIDIAFYRSQLEIRSTLAKQVRDYYKLTDNAVVLSVVGKLVSWKNQSDIIEAMHLLERKDIVTHLFIIGSGPLEELLRQKAKLLNKSKVIFSGFLDPEKLPAYYAATDIYVHPASMEPHSLSISEAIYMGCPVILSDQCGSYGENDDVSEGHNGFVYPFGDIESLAGKIEVLSTNLGLRKSFSNASHIRAEKFQQISHVEIINSLLRNECVIAG